MCSSGAGWLIKTTEPARNELIQAKLIIKSSDFPRKGNVLIVWLPILIQVTLYSLISFLGSYSLSLFWIEDAGIAVFRDSSMVKVEVDYWLVCWCRTGFNTCPGTNSLREFGMSPGSWIYY